MTSQQPYQRPLPPPPQDWQPQPRRKGGGAKKALAILLVLLLLLSVLFITPIGKTFLADLAGNSYAESASFTLVRDITIDISQGEINWACDIPVPEDISGGSIQDIISVMASPSVAPSQKYGDDWIVWTGTDTDTVTLTMTCTATVRTVIWNIDASISGSTSDIPQDVLGRYGGNEWEIEDDDGNPTGEYMIWPEHPTIQALAGSLTSEGLTVYENVKSIYDYLRDNLDYEAIPGSEPKQCLRTLADRTGDCDDQSILFVSLLRAAGIPAWLAFGMLHDQGTGEWGAHAWAEVYIPLETGTSGSVAVDIVNDEFLVRNCNRLEEWESDGNGEHFSDYYHILSYNYSVSGPHPQIPIVELGDEYSGDYEASSGRVSGSLDISEALPWGIGRTRKVF